MTSARRASQAQASDGNAQEESTEFQDSLHQAITASRLTLQTISRRLGLAGHRVSATTLSNWQRGTTRPRRRSSVQALDALEAILGLSSGALASLLRSSPADCQAELVSARDSMGRLLARLGHGESTRAPLSGYETLNVEETHYIGADGLPTRHRTRQVIRAQRDGLDAYHFLYLTRDGNAPDDAHGQVSAVSGCSLTQSLFEPPDLSCAVLRFPQPLRRGETHLFEYETLLDYREPPEPELRRALSRELEQVLLRVVFDPEAAPRTVDAVAWEAPESAPRQVARLRQSPDGSTHHLLLRPRPGIYGIRWQW